MDEEPAGLQSSILNWLPQDIVHACTRRLTHIVTTAFFGNVQIIGKEKIPLEGPVIFVGNHNNQFVDAFLIVASIPRRIFFLIAAVSLKVRWVGLFARLMGAIPVERPQDAKYSGLGRITRVVRADTSASPSDAVSDILWSVYGNEDTQFTQDVKVGDRLRVSSGVIAEAEEREAENPFNSSSSQESLTTTPNVNSGSRESAFRSLVVNQVLSDRHMLARLEPIQEAPFREKGLSRIDGFLVHDIFDEGGGSSPSPVLVESSSHSGSQSRFTVFPKVCQTRVYERVSQTLSEGDCVCIFPEGGSHDRPHLLPLKPGVALFALQAYDAGVTDVMIVPVGLHYFGRHKLGSSAILEIGRAIAVSEEIMTEFRAGGSRKHEAVQTLLGTIKEAMQKVTITAESYKMLETIQRCSEVFLPERFEPTNEVKHKIQAALSTIFAETEPPRELLVELAHSYTKALEAKGFVDSDVLHMARYQSRRRSLTAIKIRVHLILLMKIAHFLLCVLVTLPWLMLIVPIRYFATKRTTAAARASTVKIVGVDVFASTKIEMFLTCYPVAALCIASAVTWFYAATTTQRYCYFAATVLFLSLSTYYGLHVVAKATTLLKQINCYYNMCLNQYSATDGGANLIVQRRTLQIAAVNQVREAIEKVSELSAVGKGALSVLDGICPLDCIQRVETVSAKQNLAAIYALLQASSSSRDEII